MVTAIVLLFCLLTAIAPARAESVVTLTAQEQAYLTAHGPVRFCADPDWAPFETIAADGTHEGIAADLLRLAAERAGIILQLVQTRDWDDSIAASRDGRCEMLSFLNRTTRREEWLTFTEPLFNDPNVFITREEHPYIVDPATLTNESIVFPSGTSMEDLVRRTYPNLRILITGSEDDAVAMVAQKKATMTMRSLTVAAYTIRDKGLFTLKIAGQLPGVSNQLRLGIAKDEPQLRDIFNKGIATITPLERGQIVNRHITIKMESGIDYRLIWEIIIGFGIALSATLVWSVKLRKLNERLARQSQTDTLTNLPNRTRLNALFPQEIQRANRHRRPLSIIMIDLDHFKMVNDVYGHMMGDKVLIAFADIVRPLVRGYDSVGRWGGEEFLILCPETARDQAMRLAERVCAAIRDHAFPTGIRHSISAGVAELAVGDDIDSLLQRADTALYQAKNGGRDRVCAL